MTWNFTKIIFLHRYFWGILVIVGFTEWKSFIYAFKKPENVILIEIVLQEIIFQHWWGPIDNEFT